MKHTKTSARLSKTNTYRIEIPEHLAVGLAILGRNHGLNSIHAVVNFISAWAIGQQSITPEGNLPFGHDDGEQ